MAHSTGQFNPIRTAACELINSMKKGVRWVLITIRKTLNLVFIERVNYKRGQCKILQENEIFSLLAAQNIFRHVIKLRVHKMETIEERHIFPLYNHLTV
jgi:hypothetical protein